MLTNRIINLSTRCSKLIFSQKLKPLVSLCQVKGFTDHTKLLLKRDDGSPRTYYKSSDKGSSIVLELLDFNFNDPNVTSSDTIKTLTKFVQLCKQETRPPEKLVHQDFFKNLCELIDSQTDNLTLSEALQILDLLQKLAIPSSSNNISHLLDRIDGFLSEASMRDYNRIMQLITGMPRLPSAQAMETRLIKKFIIKISSELDKNNFEFLVEALRFACFNMKDKSILNVIIDALKNNDFDNQSLESIQSLMKTLNATNYYPAECDEILAKVQNALIINIAKIDNKSITVILNMSARKIQKSRLKQFYNKTLFDTAIQKLIATECRVNEGIEALEALLNAKHMSKDFLDYLTGKIYAESEFDGLTIRDSMLFLMIEGFANLQYKPFCWEMFLDLFQRIDFYRYSPETLLYRAHHLACLDCYEPKLLGTIFNMNFDFKRSRATHSTLLRLYQKLKTAPNYSGPLLSERKIETFESLIRPITDYPLYTSLVEGLGGPEYVISNVQTKLYHQIDHVIALQPGGEPLPIKDFMKQENVKQDARYPLECLENLNIPEDCQTVAIMRSSMYWYYRNSNRMLGTFVTYYDTLEALSCKVVVVPDSEWLSLSKNERTAYLMDNIKNKLDGHIRDKESVS